MQRSAQRTFPAITVTADCLLLGNEKQKNKKNPCCSQIYRDCRHNSLMKPACMHIYSTTVRLTIYQTDSKTHNPKHYLLVNQRLCSLPCSTHVMLSELKVQRKTNLPTLSERFHLALQSCVDFMFLFGFPQTAL